MSFNYSLKYKKFSQLLSEVRVDFSNYALENLIDPAQLIKVARRCNYTLGLRINKTREALIEVDKGRAKLPDDFYTVNFAMVCGSFTETIINPQGIHTEEVPINVVAPKYRGQPAHVDLCTPPIICSNCNLVPCGCGTTVLNTPLPACGCTSTPCSCIATNSCTAVYNPLEPYGDWYVKPRVFLDCKGNGFELVQILSTSTRRHHVSHPLRFINNAEGVECGCPGLYMRSMDEAWIKDGFLYVNFGHRAEPHRCDNTCQPGCAKTTVDNCPTQHANVYINYQGELTDEDGDLLVPDHEELNFFYEYSLKETILENLWLAGEDVQAKLQYMTQKRIIAKGQAKQIVQTPNFAEMKEMYLKNRQAQHANYYAQFASYSWFDNSGYNGYLGLPIR